MSHYSLLYKFGMLIFGGFEVNIPFYSSLVITTIYISKKCFTLNYMFLKIKFNPWEENNFSCQSFVSQL